MTTPYLFDIKNGIKEVSNMLDHRKQIIEIYRTEMQFWNLISDIHINKKERYTRYIPKDNNCLREADKLVLEDSITDGLNDILLVKKPKRVIISPEYAISGDHNILGIAKEQLLNIFDRIIFKQDPSACLYLYAENIMVHEMPKNLRIACLKKPNDSRRFRTE